jgi:ribonucleases P/MRP protein subunit RPP40
MFLDKEAYERAGLVGKPHGVKGKRCSKPRWSKCGHEAQISSAIQLIVLVVEFDLTSTSMFPGKKGFDRLIYASKNALNTPVSWLFCNAATTGSNISTTIAMFH